MTVPDGAGGLIGIALNRRGRDFSDSDVETLNLLRPHILQAHTVHTLITAAAPLEPVIPVVGPPLTGRQWQILRLVADGHSDHAIGRLLGISTRTVQAHLQHAYRALHASSRTEALARLRTRHVRP